MKTLNSIFSILIVISFSSISFQAFGGDEKGSTAVSREEQITRFSNSLSGLSMEEVMTLFKGMDAKFRSEVLVSLARELELTKTSVASLKEQVAEAQALVDFERSTPEGQRQKTARQTAKLQVDGRLLLLSVGGFGVYGLSLIPYYKLQNAKTTLGTSTYVASGVLGVSGLLVGILGIMAIIATEETVDYPVENLKKLQQDLFRLEAKIDAESALIMIFQARYGV